jgi:Ca-activated chloride channel family protein
LLEFPIVDRGESYGRASADFKFAAAVASFGMILRDSPNRGSANYASVLELASESRGADASGYRAEFINLVKKAQSLSHAR